MNPSTPPDYSMSPATDVYAAQQLGPPRWSALAVTAFVMSLVGFLGATAILGIIFAIAGIAVTRGGRRRGLGLAISAIPISLATGLVGAYLMLALVSLWKMTDTTIQFERAMCGSGDSTTIADVVLANATTSFQKDASKDQLAAWLGEVNHKHGKLIKFDRTITPDLFTADSERAMFNLPGKFVNGPALVQFTFEQHSLTQPLLDDIEVDGLSPRASSGDLQKNKP